MRILLVEDHDPSATTVMVGLSLPTFGHDLQHASSLKAALELVTTTTFDAALVDLGLPDAEGKDAPLAIKHEAPSLAVVVLTGADFDQVGEVLIRAGIQDFLPKGETSLQRIDQVLRVARMRQRNEDRLLQQATTDSLTGLPNQAQFRKELYRALCSAERVSRRVAVLMIDVDDFKQVNDCYGHLAGDEYLKGFATHLSHVLRGGDTAARTGGDEFGAVLVNVDSVEQASVLAESIRKRLCRTLVIDGVSYPVSASVGVAVYPEHGQDLEDLLKHADRAMYTCKQDSKNYARQASP